MTSSQIKFLVLLFALVNVWVIIHIPEVSEALLKLVTVGEVPITHKILSPDTMLYAAGSSFFVCVLLIFSREISRLFRKKAAQPAEQPEKAATRKPIAVVAPQTTRRSVVVSVEPLEGVSGKPKRSFKLHINLQPLKLAAARIARATGHAAKASLAACQRALKAGWARLLPVLLDMLFMLKKLVRVTKMLALDFWRWFEPHARRYDRVIEKKLRRIDATNYALQAGAEVKRYISGDLRKASQGLKAARESARKAWRAIDPQ